MPAIGGRVLHTLDRCRSQDSTVCARFYAISARRDADTDTPGGASPAAVLLSSATRADYMAASGEPYGESASAGYYAQS